MDYASEIKCFIDVVKNVQKYVSYIGTDADNMDNRRKLEESRERAKQLDSSISRRLKEKNSQTIVVESEEERKLELFYLRNSEKWKIIYKDSMKQEASSPLLRSRNTGHSISSNSSPNPSSPQDRNDHRAPTGNLTKLAVLEGKQYSSKEEIMREIVQERNKEISNIKEELVEVVGMFKMTADMVQEQGHTLDAIEANMEEIEVTTEETVDIISKSAKENATIWPVSGAAIGGIVLGGIGSLLGPVGIAVGGTAGATLGSYVGNSVGQFQRDVVDKEVFERQLRDKWVSDADATHCGLCNGEFTSFFRKHHCRSCGGVFCADCSSKKLEFKLNNMDKPRMERACKTCYDKYWSQ